MFLGLGYSALSTNLIINGTIIVEKYDPNTTIYWALQDRNSDNIKETLVLSSEEVTGKEQGNFATNSSFSDSNQVPWIATSDYSTTSNKSYNVTTVNIEKEIRPMSTAYWFRGVGYNATRFSANL